MTTADLKAEMQIGFDQLRILRDELRLKMHLAGMEAKTEWNKLEPQAAAIERAAHDVSEEAHLALKTLLKGLSDLKASMK